MPQQDAGQPRELGLGDLTGLLGQGPDMLLEVLSQVVNGIGVGVEWTGDQIAKLGELQQQLADKMSDLTGGEE
jgi:hypothetical protein